MKTTILASTKVGYEMPKKEAILFSGHEAGICYMPDDINTLFSEPEEKTLKRGNGTLNSGHHSVFGHIYYNYAFEEIPKILAMVLNNEKVYNTSEKSARYTKMKTSPKEDKLYLKWIDIFKEKIHEKYESIDDKKAKKLAQENARYLISVFTPATTMGYTVDLRQMNYMISWMNDFVENSENTEFNNRLKKVFKEFDSTVSEIKVDNLKDVRRTGFSLFAKRNRKEEWGENYCTNYKGTFAELAQAQRHRTLKYEFSFLEKPEFFVPYIIRGTELEDEWIKDISSLSDEFPQGMLVNINERGSIEDFVMKCKERLCGYAQLEIALQTKSTMDKYLQNVKGTELYDYLLPYSKGARCTFADYKCTSPCMWGAKYALDRLI